MQRHPHYLEKFIEVICWIMILAILIATIRGAADFFHEFFYP